MTGRAVNQVFDNYQKARLSFVQSMANLSTRPHNLDSMKMAEVVDLLQPLLTDVAPAVQQTAAVALGRLANHDVKVAQGIVGRNLVPQLVVEMGKQTKFYKRAVLWVFRAISRHTAELANMVVKGGGLDAAVVCLENFDTAVKEAAAWTVGYVARHGAALAQAVANAAAVPLLVLCLQEPDLNLRQVAASALRDVARHSSDLAQIVVDAGAVPFLARSTCDPASRLQQQALGTLAAIAKHKADLAEVVVESDVMKETLLLLKHPQMEVRRNASSLMREVVKHTVELAQLVVNSGGIGGLVDMVGNETDPSAKLPAVIALGYVSSQSDQLASAVIASQVVPILATILGTETDQSVLGATTWSLGEIGKYSPEHAKSLAVAGILPRLLELHLQTSSSEDLVQKTRHTLKLVLQKCLSLGALEPLLYDAPPHILKYIVGQFSKVLPYDVKARRLFVETGSLKRVQEIVAESGSTLMEYITVINSCFPPEIVRYYSPGFPESLLEQVEQYQPQIPATFDNVNRRQMSVDDQPADLHLHEDDQ